MDWQLQEFGFAEETWSHHCKVLSERFWESRITVSFSDSPQHLLNIFQNTSSSLSSSQSRCMILPLMYLCCLVA